MPKYIEAVSAATIIAEKHGTPIAELVDTFAEIPDADVAPVRHGRWLTWEEQFPAHIPSKKSGLGVFCSTCHKHADNMYDYCPNCGAKMDKEVANERMD